MYQLDDLIPSHPTHAACRQETASDAQGVLPEARCQVSGHIEKGRVFISLACKQNNDQAAELHSLNNETTQRLLLLRRRSE